MPYNNPYNRSIANVMDGINERFAHLYAYSPVDGRGNPFALEGGSSAGVLFQMGNASKRDGEDNIVNKSKSAVKWGCVNPLDSFPTMMSASGVATSSSFAFTPPPPPPPSTDESGDDDTDDDPPPPPPLEDDEEEIDAFEDSL